MTTKTTASVPVVFVVEMPGSLQTGTDKDLETKVKTALLGTVYENCPVVILENGQRLTCVSAPPQVAQFLIQD